jgi:DNA polymerase-1
MLTPWELDCALVQPLQDMMFIGMKVDEEERTLLSEMEHDRWNDLQAKLEGMVGRDFNVQSNPQMKELLYEEFKLPQRKNKGAVTCDETAIRSLMGWTTEKVRSMKSKRGIDTWTEVLDVLKLILSIREVRKTVSSFLDVLLDDDNRARSTWRIAGTKSFRFACTKNSWNTGLNLQTVPEKLRSIFIADDGMEMAQFDLNRGESWIYSHLAEDPLMMQVHQDGGDFHIMTACAISEAFGQPVKMSEWEAFKAEDSHRAYRLRYLGKKFNHAAAYRMQAATATDTVNAEADDTGITISLRQAKLALQLWLGRYPFIRSWWAFIDNALVTYPHQLVTPYGRVRTFYDIRPDTGGRLNGHVLKDATSWVPQSASADYMNQGLVRVYEEILKPGRWGTQLLNQLHDSIVIQYRQEYRDQVLPRVVDLLTQTIVVNGYDITIPIEAEYGPNWGSLEEWNVCA